MRPILICLFFLHGLSYAQEDSDTTIEMQLIKIQRENIKLLREIAALEKIRELQSHIQLLHGNTEGPVVNAGRESAFTVEDMGRVVLEECLLSGSQLICNITLKPEHNAKFSLTLLAKNSSCRIVDDQGSRVFRKNGKYRPPSTLAPYIVTGQVNRAIEG